MTKNRQRLIILASSLVIFILILVIKNQFTNVISQKQTPVFKIKKDSIFELIISKDKTIINLQKKRNGWFVTGTNEYKADKERVDKILESIIILNKKEIASTNKNRHQELGLGNEKLQIKTGSNVYTIFIGKTYSFDKNYLRINNQNDVFIASGFDMLFTPLDYRDLQVNIIDNENKVTNIEINSPGIKTILIKKNNNWHIGKTIAKRNRVDYFLNDLKTLKADDILLKESNLPKAAEFEITIIENGQKKSANFYLKDKEEYFIKKSNSIFIFQIPAVYVSSLKKAEQDFTQD